MLIAFSLFVKTFSLVLILHTLYFDLLKQKSECRLRGLFLTLSGHYCPNGTRYSTEFPCPPGTFNNITGLVTDTDCFACLGKTRQV